MIKRTAEDKAIKYATRDLPTLARATALATGRTAAVQGGGNLGVWPAWLANEFETVYCFEPAAELFPQLVANTSVANVIRFQAALGYERGLVSTSAVRSDGKNSHPGVTHIAGAGVIPTLRVDDLGLPACHLLALDLEGFELFALLGAAETVERCRPVIVVEINQHCERYGVSAEDVRGWLTGRGYRLECREHSDEIYVPLERAA